MNIVQLILNVVVNYIFLTHGSSDGDIRLVGGETPFVGQVEFFYNGKWGAVCGNFKWLRWDWDWDEAEVTCKQLGHPGAMFFGNEQITDITTIRLDCDGSEGRLSGCTVSDDGWEDSSDCTSIATVTCYFSGYVGCVKDCINTQKPCDDQEYFNEISSIRTIQECLEICRNQSYLHSALSGGNICSCGNDFGQDSLVDNEECSKECDGDANQACGNDDDRNMGFVYRTYSVFNTSGGECGGELSSSHGVIYSPGFPGNYSPSVDCSWNVSMPENSDDVIIIEFELTMLEMNSGDQLVLIGSRDEEKKYPLISSAALPFLFNFTSPVTIKFQSTAISSGNLGFVINFSGFKAGPGCELPDLYNGKFTPDWPIYYPGDSVSVLCDPGFMPSVYEILCLENLTWSGYLNCTYFTQPYELTTTQTTSTSGNGTGGNAASSQDSASIAGTAVGIVMAVLVVVGGLLAFIYVYRKRSNAQAVKNLQKLALAQNSSVNSQADPRYDRVPTNDLTRLPQPTHSTSGSYDGARTSSPNSVSENGGEEEHYYSQPGPGRDGAVDDDSSVYYSELDPKITANVGAKMASYSVVRPKSKLAGTQGEATDWKRADTQGDFVDNLLYSGDAGPSGNAAAQDDGKLPSGNGFADNILYQPSGVTPDGDFVDNVIYHGAESGEDTTQKLQPLARPTGNGLGDHQKPPIGDKNGEGFVDNLLYQASSGLPDEDFVDNTIYQPADE